MLRVRDLLALAVGWSLACVPAVHAQAGSPAEPDCLGLATGSTGLLQVNGTIPTGDSLAGRQGGYGDPAPEQVARTLPDDVLLRSSTQTFSNVHAFVLREGRIYVRPAEVGRTSRSEPWRVLELPACLDGHVTAISADHRLLLAIGRGRQLYSHDMPGDDVSAERWTWRWGPYFWSGAGVRMFGDTGAWAASEFTSQERFTDSSGREQAPIGVATVYVLRDAGRRLTYLDPWLPSDESREVCLPRHGTLPLTALGASGSTVFAASHRGELFTRLYDFDTSGANTVFGTFSWEQDRPAGDTRWQLPGPDWARQPVPRGATITDRLTIAKTGPAPGQRVLRIEGRTARGRVGVWEKPIDDRRARAWRFAATGGSLQGTILRRRTPAQTTAPEALRFAGTIAGATAELTGLSPVCSPAPLRVTFADGTVLDLVLHTSDGLRQETRARGLDDTPREYNGAIEVPRATFAALRGAARDWVATTLQGKRILATPVALTATRLRFIDRCWELTRDGRPARPDVPRVPPDLGAVVARTTERQQDGRSPGPC